MRILGLTLAVLVAASSVTAFAQVGGSSQNHDNRVEAVLDNLDMNYEIDSDGDFKMIIEFDDDRSQVVFVSSTTYELNDLEIREVWSVGHISENRLSAVVANRLLEESSEVILGGWEVQDWGGEQVAVFRAKMSANVSGDALYSAISAVSQTADEMEKALVGTDEL